MGTDIAPPGDQQVPGHGGPHCWVIVAGSDEVGDAMLDRTAWGRRLLLYRTTAGQPVVLDNRCSHRQYPLSLGERRGDDVICGYHGFRYDYGGNCVEIPSQEAIPDRARVHAYAVVERGGWVWAWLGGTDHTEYRDAPAPLEVGIWRSVGGVARIAVPPTLLVENLHDLSHISFVHVSTIGSSAFAERPYDSCDEGTVLRTVRRWPDVDCPPMYQRSAGLTGPVDRVIETAFHLPSLVVIDSQIRPSGASVDEARRIIHEIAVVPESDTSLHYVWRSSWNFALDDDSVATVIAESEQQVIAEDQIVLEAQWASIQHGGGTPVEISVRADRGSLRARRAFEHVLRAGRLPEPSPAASS